ncbi:PucR family transcriptional regulator [Gordonia sp. VNK21]|uniref:PucR family transcriptional regulator n=1 Tax=Gordonia sp. VNK21 TaxID=3382483 RepID=UPI0038D3B85A
MGAESTGMEPLTLTAILAAAEGILAPLDPAAGAGELGRAVEGFEFHQPGTVTDYRGRLVLVTVPTQDPASLERVCAECAEATALILQPSTPRTLRTESGPVLLRRSTWATGEILIRAMTAIIGMPGTALRRADPAEVLARDAAQVVVRRESALLALLSGTAETAIPATIAGLRPDRRYLVIAAGVGVPDAEWFRVAVSMEFPQVRDVVSDGVFLGVLPVDDDDQAQTCADRLRTRFSRSGHGGRDLPIGVGPIVDGVGELHRSAAEAGLVLRALNVKLGGLPLVDAGQVRVARAGDVEDALALIQAVDALKPHAESFAARLRILERYDRDNRTDLLPTALAALKNQTNVAAAARPLGIHANSMRARIDRISAVAGIDLSDEVCRLRTILAFIACPDIHRVALSRLPLDR